MSLKGQSLPRILGFYPYSLLWFTSKLFIGHQIRDSEHTKLSLATSWHFVAIPTFHQVGAFLWTSKRLVGHDYHQLLAQFVHIEIIFAIISRKSETEIMFPVWPPKLRKIARGIKYHSDVPIDFANAKPSCIYGVSAHTHAPGCSFWFGQTKHLNQNGASQRKINLLNFWL